MHPFLEDFFGSPPARMKVFAPNGETKETICWLGIRHHARYPELTELFLLFGNGDTEVLNKKVVVQNLETGKVVYDPRLASKHFEDKTFLTGSEVNWLRRNPAWPNLLELDDNPVDPVDPVDNGGEPDDLYA
jgi:hypothetical protein